LRELLVMAEARGKDNWNHTSSLMALLFNVNRDPKKQKAVLPETFNPYVIRKPKKDTRLAFEFMKELWGGTMENNSKQDK
jgi:hypothetical protein